MDRDEEHEREGPGTVSCGNCRHYYVTWDKLFPYGCRAMGFKSKTSPSASVRQASGMDCQLFVKKGQKSM
jgi:hypothetical protein